MKTNILLLIVAAAAPLHAGLLPLGEHVDIRWRWATAAGWTCRAVTDSNGELEHDPDTVFLPLSDKPYANGGSRFAQPASENYDFTGVADGEPLWIAVQGTPGDGEAWPGFENNQPPGTFGSYIPEDERLSPIEAAWIKISLVSYTPPAGSGSHFSLWTTSGGIPTVWMSTFESPVANDFYFTEGSHNHVSWGFGAPGIHKVRLQASAFAGPGETNPTGPSAVFTLTFAIGPFARWQAEHFTSAELDDPALTGPAADYDRDGLDNLVEHAFGYDPRDGAQTPVAAGLGLPKLSLVEEGGMFFEVLEYPRRRAGEEVFPLIYQPHFSADLNGWSDQGVVTTAVDFPPELDALNAVWELAASRRPVGASAPSRGLARVAVGFGE